MPRLSFLQVCTVVSLLLAVPSARAEEKRTFRAGAFAVDITPEKFPISVNGGMQDRQAKEARDRLHARCLVLDDEITRIAIVVCDSCMLPRELLDEAKQRASKTTGIPTTHMLISATHTHTAPTATGVFQSDPDKDYVKFLAERIAQGIEKANARRAPARIGWGVGKEPGQVFNRRWKMKPGTIQADPFGRLNDQVKMNPGYQNPGLVEQAGPIDPEVAVVSVQSREGRPIALLANYSLHYVGGVEPLSADYFGAFAERIGQLLKIEKSDGFVGILSNGTSGDINNVDFANAAPGKREAFEQIKVVADAVAKVALATEQKIAYHAWVPLAMVEKEIELGVRKPPAEDLARAKDMLARTKILKTMPEVYARETVLMADYPARVSLKLQALRIGELGIVAIPCETFVEIGLELKKRSRLKPTFTIELANGYNGYLPTPEQHRLGGYETWRARSSYLEVDASTKIAVTLLELLGKVGK